MRTAKNRLVKKLVVGGLVGAAFGVAAGWILASRTASESRPVIDGDTDKPAETVSLNDAIRLAFAFFRVARQALDLIRKV